MSDADGKILVFFPSFGDAAALPGLIEDVERLGGRFRALVVDDGSPVPVLPDSIVDRCLYVRLPANFGLGIATHIALTHALRHGYEAVVRVDSDGQHPVPEIPRLVDELDAGRADVVVATRGNHGAGWGPSTLARRMAKAYLSFLSRALTGGRAPRDVNSGFFILNHAAMSMINQTTLERFPEPEIFTTACRSGLRVRTIKIQQLARQEGRSTLGIVYGLQMMFRFHVFAAGALLRRKRR